MLLYVKNALLIKYSNYLINSVTIVLFKINFFGLCNFFFKFEKKNLFFSTGLKNMYFFLFFLKKYLFCHQIELKFNFIKKNHNSIMLLKSPIKYKISKHILTHHKNKFVISIQFIASIIDYKMFSKLFNITTFLKSINFFSTPLMSVTAVRLHCILNCQNLLMYK